MGVRRKSYEKVVYPTVTCEKKRCKFSVQEIKCLRSVLVVTWMDRALQLALNLHGHMDF